MGLLWHGRTDAQTTHGYRTNKFSIQYSRDDNVKGREKILTVFKIPTDQEKLIGISSIVSDRPRKSERDSRSPELLTWG